MASELIAQDTLFKTDGTQMAVRIIASDLVLLKYKKYMDTTGPVFVIHKNFVSKIVFEDGKTESFAKTEQPVSKNTTTDLNRIKFKRNLLSINATDLIFGMITFSYEYTLKSGNYSLSWPVSTGLNSFGTASTGQIRTGYYSRDRIFGTGFDFNFYPGGQSSAAFYMGASAEYGIYHFIHTYWDPLSSASFQQIEVATQYGIIVKSGISCQFGNHYNVNMVAGFGYSRTKDYYDWYGRLAFRGGICLGYRF